MLFGWSRAILLQLAHPLLAAGVMEHSAFRDGVFTAASRLHHTVRSMLALTFGTDAERDQTIADINQIHRRVNGALRHTVGRHPAGTPYSAEDSALLVWVHATLLDSIPLVYDRLMEPLPIEDRDRYCLEAAPIALALGARPEDVPRSWQDVQQYLRATVDSGTIVVGPDARTLAAAVLAPPFAVTIAPLAALNRVVTIGMLPPWLRTQYGFTWSDRDERAFDRWSRRLRRFRHALPDRLALWPEARRLRAGA